MITFLKKRKHSRTARLLEYFKKPTIRIIDDEVDDDASTGASTDAKITNDVASVVEIQRGLGASKLAISSVGGTVNFVMNSIINIFLNDSDYTVYNIINVSKITLHFAIIKYFNRLILGY